MKTISAHVGETRNGFPCCELRETDAKGVVTVIAKLYANADGSKIRIVLPELKNYGQTLISPDNRMIEFTRKI